MEIHEIATGLGSPDAKLRFRQGTIVAANTAGTVDVTIAGSSVVVPGVRALAQVCPVPGAAVWIATDGRDMIVLGHLAPLFAACRLRRPSALSIPTGSSTTVVYTSSPDGFDPLVMLGAGVVEIKVPGVYVITGYIQWSVNGTGIRMLSLQRDADSLMVASQSIPAHATSSARCNVAAIIECHAGDQFQLLAYQNSGGALDIQAGATFAAAWQCPLW